MTQSPLLNGFLRGQVLNECERFLFRSFCSNLFPAIMYVIAELLSYSQLATESTEISLAWR